MEVLLILVARDKAYAANSCLISIPKSNLAMVGATPNTADPLTWNTSGLRYYVSSHFSI